MLLFRQVPASLHRQVMRLPPGYLYIITKELQEFGTDGVFSFGTNITNLGSKISYIDAGPKYFLPANLKIGAADMVNLYDYNQLTFTFDINKLLTPAPPIRDGNGVIIKGKDDNVSVPAGVFASFSDAPGGGSAVLHEFTLSPGIEYWYNQMFAVRAGFFYESANNPYNPCPRWLTIFNPGRWL